MECDIEMIICTTRWYHYTLHSSSLSNHNLPYIQIDCLCGNTDKDRRGSLACADLKLIPVVVSRNSHWNPLLGSVWLRLLLTDNRTKIGKRRKIKLGWQLSDSLICQRPKLMANCTWISSCSGVHRPSDIQVTRTYLSPDEDWTLCGRILLYRNEMKSEEFF